MDRVGNAVGVWERDGVSDGVPSWEGVRVSGAVRVGVVVGVFLVSVWERDGSSDNDTEGEPIEFENVAESVGSIERENDGVSDFDLLLQIRFLQE